MMEYLYLLGVCFGLKRMLFLVILVVMLLVAGCAGQQGGPSAGNPASSAPGQSGPGFSKADPAPINSAVAFHEAVNDSGQGTADYSVRLTLVEVLRGSAAAEKMVHDIPFFIVNNPPDREFLLAHFKYELSDASPSGFSRLVNRNPFEISINGNIDPDNNKFILGPKPDFYGKIQRGGVVDGWIAYTIPKDARGPLIVYGRNFVGTDGIWFKTS